MSHEIDDIIDYDSDTESSSSIELVEMSEPEDVTHELDQPAAAADRPSGVLTPDNASDRDRSESSHSDSFEVIDAAPEDMPQIAAGIPSPRPTSYSNPIPFSPIFSEDTHSPLEMHPTLTAGPPVTHPLEVDIAGSATNPSVWEDMSEEEDEFYEVDVTQPTPPQAIGMNYEVMRPVLRELSHMKNLHFQLVIFCVRSYLDT